MAEEDVDADGRAMFRGSDFGDVNHLTGGDNRGVTIDEYGDVWRGNSVLGRASQVSYIPDLVLPTKEAGSSSALPQGYGAHGRSNPFSGLLFVVGLVVALPVLSLTWMGISHTFDHYRFQKEASDLAKANKELEVATQNIEESSRFKRLLGKYKSVRAAEVAYIQQDEKSIRELSNPEFVRRLSFYRALTYADRTEYVKNLPIVFQYVEVNGIMDRNSFLGEYSICKKKRNEYCVDEQGGGSKNIKVLLGLMDLGLVVWRDKVCVRENVSTQGCKETNALLSASAHTPPV